MTKAAKKQTEAPADIGHNANSEREQFEEISFLNAVRQIKDIKSNIATEMGDAKDIYDRIKPLGFTKGDVKWALELEDKDAGDVIATMQRRVRIAKMLGHGVARQFTFFDEDRTPLEDRAYDEGMAAGKLRKSAINPYGMDSEAGQAWQRGMNDGTAIANKALADELIKADTDDGDPGFAAE